MLLDLENNGNEVYYSAPSFHTPEELNEAYLLHQVRMRSLWLRPSVIGPLPDDGSHHVAFQVPGTRHFCSKPRLLDTKGDFEEFTRSVEGSYRKRGEMALSKNALHHMADTIAEIAAKRRDISSDSKRFRTPN